MGELEIGIANGTPSRHCGRAREHHRHPNSEDETWCDGVPPLEPFVELTVRATTAELFGDMNPSHDQALHLVARYGLGLLLDCLDNPETAMVLRVRTGDGQDRVYPLLKRKGEKGLAAVVMNDGG